MDSPLPPSYPPPASLARGSPPGACKEKRPPAKGRPFRCTACQRLEERPPDERLPEDFRLEDRALGRSLELRLAEGRLEERLLDDLLLLADLRPELAEGRLLEDLLLLEERLRPELAEARLLEERLLEDLLPDDLLPELAEGRLLEDLLLLEERLRPELAEARVLDERRGLLPVPPALLASPDSARSLFTVRAAISSARPFWPRFS